MVFGKEVNLVSIIQDRETQLIAQRPLRKGERWRELILRIVDFFNSPPDLVIWGSILFVGGVAMLFFPLRIAAAILGLIREIEELTGYSLFLRRAAVSGVEIAILSILPNLIAGSLMILRGVKLGREDLKSVKGSLRNI